MNTFVTLHVAIDEVFIMQKYQNTEYRKHEFFKHIRWYLGQSIS